MKDMVPVQASMQNTTESAVGQTSSAAKFFRDEKSRVRIEHADTAIISDPVKGENFILDKPKMTATPLPVPPPPPPGVKPPEMPPLPEMPKVPGAPKLPPPPEFKQTKDLGEKVVNGVKAEGKEYEAQVPGMAAPIKKEEWTSPELKMPVKTTITDPKTGMKSVTEMKDIVPGAKIDPAMFQVPPGFKMQPPLKPHIPFPKG